METQKQENDVIEINIPLRINLAGKRSEIEKSFIAMEHLEIKTQTLLKHINLLNVSASGFMIEVDQMTAIDFSDMSSELILSFLEVITNERTKLERLLRQEKA